eukprot:gb/GECG01011605.1/.p1 GENE.gb/GECG01011605.1/~~gb/GECG01011605.1/.p1  ORF type:complete len:490 (+),score=90.87 gb/GECG01011605.1/:1-1470(+)
MDDKVSHAFGRRRGSTHQQREALKDLATSQHVGEVRKRATAGVEEKLKNEKASPLSWDRSHHRRASLTRESSAVVDKKIRKTSHPKMQVPVEETTRKEVGFEAQYGKDPTLSIMSKKRLRALLEETAAAGLRIPPTVYETLDTSKVRGDQATLKEIEENAEALRQIISDNSFSQAQATLDHENSSRQEKIEKLIQQLEEALDRSGLRSRPTTSTAQQTLAPVGSSFLEHLKFRSALKQPIKPWQYISKPKKGTSSIVSPEAKRNYEYNLQMHRATASKLTVARESSQLWEHINESDKNSSVPTSGPSEQSKQSPVLSPIKTRKSMASTDTNKRQTGGHSTSGRPSTRGFENYQPYSEDEVKEAEQRDQDKPIEYEDVLEGALADDMTNNEFIGTNQYQKAATMVAAQAARGEFSTLQEALEAQQQEERKLRSRTTDKIDQNLRPSKHHRLLREDDDFRKEVATPNTRRRRKELEVARGSLQRLLPSKGE